MLPHTDRELTGLNEVCRVPGRFTTAPTFTLYYFWLLQTRKPSKAVSPSAWSIDLTWQDGTIDTAVPAISLEMIFVIEQNVLK